MKYESTILKRLIDTYGVIGNPRYLSEIIKEFIVRGKELYPHLFTYQSDWLAHIDEFGLTPEYTVSYTGHHIYAPSTKEKPVKSAILKGKTLVNLSQFHLLFDIQPSSVTTTGVSWYQQLSSQYVSNSMIKPNTKYIVKFGKNTPSRLSQIYISGMWPDGWKGHNSIIQTKDTITSTSNYQMSWSDGEKITQEEWSKVEIMIIEYQEGMENWDIPYFEGMQSVKMPVLTTSNEDGTKTNILTVNEEVELCGIDGVQDELNLITGELTENVKKMTLNGSENWTLSGTYSKFIELVGIGKLQQSTVGFCDKLPKVNIMTSSENNPVGFTMVNHDGVRLKPLEGNDNSLEDYKQWLKENPVTIYFLPQQKSIKTVDLTIHDKDHQKVERLTSFEGGTHFTTSSQDGSLLPTLTVDVVTDLEKTLMVCSLEGNTM